MSGALFDVGTDAEMARAGSDVSRAMALYALIATPDRADGERMVMVTVPGHPPSKVRPRFGKGRTYNPRSVVVAEERTAGFIRPAIKGRPFTGNVALGCIFFRGDMYRADVDNMLKHVCDAANGVAWVDDSQVTAVLGIAELDRDNPRTIIVLGHHASSLLRGSDAVAECEGCGKEYSIRSIDRLAERKYCSRRCARAQHPAPLAELVPCPICGEPFRRKTTAQQLCSPACRAAHLSAKRKNVGRKVSSCASCGKQLAHNRGGRCRDCWRADPQLFPTPGPSS